MSGWIAGDCVDQDRVVEPVGTLNQTTCVAS
jgi:hypothetical protein